MIAKKNILNFIILLQGFIIIIFLLGLDFEKKYMSFIKIFTVIYFILSLCIIKIINNNIIIKEEESKDQFSEFNVEEFERDYYSRT
jgi:hypothetical protein